MIYKNDNIKIDDETVTGSVKDIRGYLKYQILDIGLNIEYNIDDFINDSGLIIDLLKELQAEKDDTKKITVFYNPMGCISYKECEDDER